jgi:hypothetical protein
MPDLASFLLRTSLGSEGIPPQRCSSCRRTPLPGETLHVLSSGRKLCALCLSDVPEDDRETIRSERVHASERHLPVSRVAAA